MASRIDELEAACRFGDAAEAAREAGDLRRAVRLAALSRDDGLTSSLVDALSEAEPPPVLLATAADLQARGHALWAAQLYERGGDVRGAAAAYLAGGDALRAGQRLEAHGAAVDAAKAYEAGLAARPGLAALRLALADLLSAHGRDEKAIRVLQAHPPTASGRASVLARLALRLREAGYRDAASEVEQELANLGTTEAGDDALSGDDAARDATAGSGTWGRNAPDDVTPPHGTAAPKKLFGRYEIDREIATTASATVFRAHDRLQQRTVALKLLSSSVKAGRDWRSRFEREARILRRLQHPAVVPLVDFHPDGPALIYAWMEGGTLAELAAREVIAPRRAIEIVSAVLGALGEAHRRGILHRDVKPSNILFDGLGAPRLSDFGAAHFADASRTVTRGAIGTALMMAPEQQRGEAATVRSDLFAAGAVLSWLLTGEDPLPAQEASPYALSDYHPDLGPEHDAALARLIALEPEHRPEDARSAQRELEQLAWSERRVARPDKPRSVRPSDRPLGDGRLGPVVDVGDGRDAPWLARDPWLERNVVVMPLDEDVFALARGFALADRRGLPTILRVDRTQNTLWVAVPQGRALADTGSEPSARAVDRLADAVARLHEVGGAHGCLDDEHLYLFEGELNLAFPRRRVETKAAGEEDRAALARIKGKRTSR